MKLNFKGLIDWLIEFQLSAKFKVDIIIMMITESNLRIVDEDSKSFDFYFPFDFQMHLHVSNFELSCEITWERNKQIIQRMVINAVIIIFNTAVIIISSLSRLSLLFACSRKSNLMQRFIVHSIHPKNDHHSLIVRIIDNRRGREN